MKAIQITRYETDLRAAIEALEIVDKPMPKPGRNQVLVKIEAAPCNPSDLIFLRGKYGVRKSLPAVPGWEGAGTVIDSGGGWLANRLKGKRVACGGQSDRDGTWAEYFIADANRCIPLQKGVSSEQGATLIINPLTALGLMERAVKQKHRALIQTAACSQVGKMVQVLARQKKLPLINIVRRAEQEQQLRSAGEEWVLNTENENWIDELQTLSEKLNATIAFEAVAGSMTGQLLSAMPTSSKMVVYGALSDESCREISPLDLIFHKKHVEGFWLTDWLQSGRFWRTFAAARFVQHLIASGAFTTTIRQRARLNEWKAALLDYQSVMSRGKAILIPAG